jgi:hypothetical protein
MLLGDPLGPRGLGGYVTLDGESSTGVYVALASAFEVRSGNEYDVPPIGADGLGFHFVQVLHRPGEKRGRMTATVESSRDARVSARASAGVERVKNFAFLGTDRTNVLASVAIVYRP